MGTPWPNMRRLRVRPSPSAIPMRGRWKSTAWTALRPSPWPAWPLVCGSARPLPMPSRAVRPPWPAARLGWRKSPLGAFAWASDRVRSPSCNFGTVARLPDRRRVCAKWSRSCAKRLPVSGSHFKARPSPSMAFGSAARPHPRFRFMSQPCGRACCRSQAKWGTVRSLTGSRRKMCRRPYTSRARRPPVPSAIRRRSKLRPV